MPVAQIVPSRITHVGINPEFSKQVSEGELSAHGILVNQQEKPSYPDRTMSKG